MITSIVFLLKEYRLSYSMQLIWNLKAFYTVVVGGSGSVSGAGAMAAILTKAKMRINFSMDDMVLRPITRRSQLNARRQVMWPY